ncbi:MAG: hypothetical protein JWL67_1868 [Solirubrobacterales bacterium]|jgi:hypothetical protein|nr:hypothetical protein [Solirubrobacterales bacterium]
MLLDDLMPAFHATRIEHRVIDSSPADVYETAIHADFVDAMRRSRIVRGMFSLRAAVERVAATAQRAPVANPSEATLRLAEMPEHGDWVRLAEDPPNEFAFGVIGRFWAGETAFEQIDASAFTSFDTPGYAKIAANLSLRSYGEQRTLLSYEARTQATDDAARRAFLRYWTVASPGVGVVMRSLLALIAEQTPHAGAQQTKSLPGAR